LNVCLWGGVSISGCGNGSLNVCLWGGVLIGGCGSVHVCGCGWVGVGVHACMWVGGNEQTSESIARWCVGKCAPGLLDPGPSTCCSLIWILTGTASTLRCCSKILLRARVPSTLSRPCLHARAREITAAQRPRILPRSCLACPVAAGEAHSLTAESRVQRPPRPAVVTVLSTRCNSCMPHPVTCATPHTRHNLRLLGSRHRNVGANTHWQVCLARAPCALPAQMLQN
jgi:hypothetical protein